MLVALWLSIHAPDLPEAPAWLEASVDGAPSCIDAAVLPQRAEAMLGPDTSPPPTRAELHVAAEPGDAFAVRLRIDASGHVVERTLTGRDCDTLTDAVALVIAVHVDPLSVATQLSMRERERERTPAASPALVPEPPPKRTSPRRRAPSAHAPSSAAAASPSRAVSRARPRLALGAAVMAELGVLPRAAGTVQLGVGVRWPRALAEVAGLVSLGGRASSSDVPGVEGTLRLYAAALRGCGVLGRAKVEAAMCGGLEAGDLQARATGLSSTTDRDALWLAVVAGVRPLVRLHPRVALGGIVDLVVPLRRHRFVVAPGPDDELAVLHTVAPIAARFGALLQIRLP